MILGLCGALMPPWRYLALIGLIPLGSALTGFCPVYAWLPVDGAPQSGFELTSERWD